ncbi:MAG TPA: DUF5665 domain-containing protein [Peptococcaceae bacterium]|jgi:hypothetical protein|nr:hypothetical protein [Clostridia bacterium]HOB81765.1 DUF5665 domain-containing protein [Peptococcaceae bacterium]HPZ70859.1 DUF5665 domain-containing protein [Peptococcaceae bacterium]HQD53670.1 DUF5665 domain-containing protein [Peptococcaceae bacterium]
MSVPKEENRHRQRDDEKNQRLVERLKDLALVMEKMKLAEYVEYMNDPKRMLLTNFLAGIARGLGMAVGFTILGALLLYLLKQLVMLNLPLISSFIAQIVEMVNENMQQ